MTTTVLQIWKLEMKPGKSSGASTEEMLPAKNTGCNRDHKRHILGYTRRTEKETKGNLWRINAFWQWEHKGILLLHREG